MRLFLALMTLLSSTTVLAHYNEMRDDRGRLRPAYQALQGSLKSLSASKRRQFKRQSRQAFEGDNALSPVPRILEPKEFEVVKTGVEQRARALKAFLQDHYSGRREYKAAGIIPEEVVRSALIRSGEMGFDGLIDPERISFFYGPDLVRAEKDGKKTWYVLEDNTGYVGGLGDLVLAQELILDLHPDLDKKLRLNDPMDFYKELAREFRRRAAANGGMAVLFRDSESNDNEGNRVEQIFSTLGIPTIKPQSVDRLVVENEKMFLRSADRQLRRVGLVLLHDEISWVDRSHPATAAQHVFDLASMFLEPGEASKELQDQVREILNTAKDGAVPSAKKLKRILIDNSYYVPSRSLIPGFIDSILAGEVDSSSSPGTNFVSDKQFYLYVDKMIRFYLNEKPILQQPKSVSLNTENIPAIFENISDWVIKRFDGRGGKVVWVGSKLKDKEVVDLRRLVEQSPQVFKAQERLQISRLDEDIVDLRLFSYVNSGQLILSDVPWGRGAPVSGDGKVNLSGKGHEVTVLIGERRSAADCEKLLR